MTLVEELRSKKSRDNRGLLDRAADRIEELEEEIAKAKTEVAREIFEEIEKTVFADMDFFKNLKKKYTGEKK